MAPFLRLDGISKSFGSRQVLRDVALGLEEGETLALLGPSGSGKTTLLRILAGFEAPDTGRVEVEGENVAALPPARRGFGMVFQHYALFPHLTVGENVGFGLDGHGLSAAARAARVSEMLTMVDLAGFENRSVQAISGGQQQRVALARALAPAPRLLLLDEPMSNLDPDLRERTRRALKATLEAVGITTILVTHEQEEAFHFGDRVALLEAGRIAQVGPPEALYRDPATRFVAGFVGRVSRLTGVWAGGEVRLAGTKAAWAAVPQAPLEEGAAVELLVRPESLELVRAKKSGALAGRVAERRFAGAATFYRVELASGEEVEVVGANGPVEVGEKVWVRLRNEAPRPRAFRREGEE